MARTINSPGVQITEKDLALKEVTPTGTITVVPGFAAQGPVSEPLQITTMSEFERIYGTPSTHAEKYFYHACREIISSPGRLTTLRLPYGDGLGTSYSNGYSVLVYPALSSVSLLPGCDTEWIVGAPIHVPLDRFEYESLISGNFAWTNTNAGTTASGSSVAGLTSIAGSATAQLSVEGAFMVLNDLQTTVNEVAEGYYIGLADNRDLTVAAGVGASSDFESITAMNAVTTDTSSVFTAVDTTRLDFALSATEYDTVRGVNSVSENLQKVGFVGFESNDYQDNISMGVFRVRRSVTDAALLTLASVERYLGSLDETRKKVSHTGGALENAYIVGNVNEDSPTVKMFANPALSHSFNWTNGGTLPTSRVTFHNESKALFPLGVYTSDTKNAEKLKVIGDVPAKLDKALRLLENVENTELDLIIDAGLSTIYSTCQFASISAYDDSTYITTPMSLIPDWSEVTSVLINFVENTRKDCFAVIDAPRSIFITGKDTKVIDLDSRSFNVDIYNPLKACAGFETNYASMYGNWVKVADPISSQSMWIPFSGPAAAVFARSDLAGHQWSAPAGVTRGGFNALDIAINPNQKQRDRLYEISVNPVVYYQGDGFCIMGQKTLQTKPTAFDRINVRRLFLALERATVRALRQFVFEPNTSFTRTKVKTTILPVFDLAKNTSGLHDFLIVSDDRNNTNDTIEQNELVVDIYVKPVKTAEYILVNFIATRTGQDFQELL